MEPQLRNFVRQLIRQAIRAGIHSVFMKMPLLWSLIAIALLIGAATYFKLY